jgi:hypothetical protein
MKKIMTFLLAGMLSLSLYSQHVFNKGDLLFNAGIGLPYNGHGFIPSINFSGEIGVIPTGDVGLVAFGGLAEIQFANYNSSIYADHTSVYFIIGPRASWHVHAFQSDKWDAYAGLGFGMVFRGQPWDNYYSSNITGYGEVFVGGRMMFSESFGLFAEVGGGPNAISALKFGVTFGF